MHGEGERGGKYPIMADTKTKAASPVENGFCPIWLPFVDALRNAFAAPSEDMLGSLVTMPDMVSHEDSALVAHTGYTPRVPVKVHEEYHV